MFKESKKYKKYNLKIAAKKISYGGDIKTNTPMF